MDKVDCFAYKRRPTPTCKALRELDCKGCSFYKDEESFQLDMKKANDRLDSLNLQDKKVNIKRFH